MLHSMKNEALATLETYSNTSDNDEDNYNSPNSNSEINSIDRNNYEGYPTPSTVNEGSNDCSDNSLNFSAVQNFQYANLIQDSNQNRHKQDMIIDPNAYNYQIQQYLSSASYNGYQQGLNNELVQPYSVANFDFNSTSSNNFSRSTEDQTQASERNYSKEIQDMPTPEKSVQEEISKNVTEDQSQAYFMQPPDSESIAAAAVTARKNRNKRRTRIKFDKEQLALLEASFLRTHYPDVGIVDRLSDLLKINTDKISIWFQNRRARYKKEKKPLKTEEELIQQNIDNQTNPLDLYEAAQLEMAEKRKQHDLNTSTNTLNESLKSNYSEQQSTKKNGSSAMSRRSLNTENDDSDSSIVKSEPPHFHQFIKAEEQSYKPVMNPELPPPNAPVYQNFFHPHMIQHNQFYQPDQQNNSYNVNTLLAPPQLNLDNTKSTNRGSISSVATSESRSISPESQSSSSPEPPGSDQYFKNEQNLTENNQNYSTMQPNMISHFMPHYQQQHFYQDENIYRQNNHPSHNEEPNNNFRPEQLYQTYNQPPMMPMYYQQPILNRLPTQPVPMKNSSNIFQPYADCNRSSEEPGQYADQNNLQTNYQSYYNQ